MESQCGKILCEKLGGTDSAILILSRTKLFVEGKGSKHSTWENDQSTGRGGKDAEGKLWKLEMGRHFGKDPWKLRRKRYMFVSNIQRYTCTDTHTCNYKNCILLRTCVHSYLISTFSPLSDFWSTYVARCSDKTPFSDRSNLLTMLHSFNSFLKFFVLH